MRRYFIIGIALIALFLCSCPDGGGTPTPGPTVTNPPGTTSNPTLPPSSTPTAKPGPVMIDDFSAYTPPVKPGADWTNVCYTTYDGVTYGANTGIMVESYAGGQKVLNLMFDIFGPGDFGNGYTGYAYAKKTYVAPAAGTISFTYYHIGYTTPPNIPSYTLEFWLDAPADLTVASPSPAADWTNSDAAAVFTSSTTKKTLPVAAGSHTLAWRVWKGITSNEDKIYIDNIQFTYQ